MLKILSEHGMILFYFNLIFVQIKIFPKIQNNISREKIRVANRRKAIKKDNFGLIAKFNIKKMTIQFEGCFFENLSYFNLLFFAKRIVDFHIDVPLIGNLISSQILTNEQIFYFQGIAHLFFGFDSEFSKFWISIWDFIDFLEFSGI